MRNISNKIILPGGAGLVGQNLVAQLINKGYSNLVVLDKHKANIEVTSPGYRRRVRERYKSGKT